MLIPPVLVHKSAPKMVCKFQLAHSLAPEAISMEGIKPTDKDVQSIRNFPTTTNISEVPSLLIRLPKILSRPPLAEPGHTFPVKQESIEEQGDYIVVDC